MALSAESLKPGSAESMLQEHLKVPGTFGMKCHAQRDAQKQEHQSIQEKGNIIRNFIQDITGTMKASAYLKGMESIQLYFKDMGIFIFPGTFRYISTFKYEQQRKRNIKYCTMLPNYILQEAQSLQEHKIGKFRN